MATDKVRQGLCSRRRFLHRASLLGVVLGLPGLSACGPSRPLRLMLHDWPGYAFMRLAVRQGRVPAGQVEMLECGGMEESVAALESGEVDAAAVTLDNVIQLRSRGLDLQVVLLFNVSAGGDALLAPPEVASLTNLRGLRVGAEDTALSAVMLNRALHAAGLSREAIEVVSITTDAVSAWESGGLDAILAYQPAVQALLHRGLRVLFDSRQTPFLIVDVLAVRRDVLADTGDALHRLIAGHFAVQDQWRRDPLNVNFALASLLGVDARHVFEVFRGLNIPDVRYNRQYLTAPAPELIRAANTLCDIMREEQACSAPLPSLSDLFVADYLPEQE